MSKSLERIGVVAGSTMFSRFLGLARDSLTAAIFGTSVWHSAYQFGFMLPNLFRRLLAEGQLMAAFVPVLAEENEQNGRAGVFALLNKVGTWLFIATAALTILAVLALGAFQLWPGIETRHVLGTQLAQTLFPYLIFVSLAAALSAVLQLFGNFSVPALTAVWLNIAIITSLGIGGTFLAETPAGKMVFLCGGVLVGGALQLFIPWRVLRREGWKPQWDTAKSERLVTMLALMGPGIIGTAIYQINFLVSRTLAFSLNESAVTVLTLANRIMEVPQGIFTVSVATVVFPLIASHAARGEMTEMAEAYSRGMRLILAVTIPGAIGVALLSEPIIRLAFQWGAFTANDTATTAPILAIYALGLPFYSWVTLAIRGSYALKDMKTPVRIAAFAFAANLVASLILMRTHGTAGLAWASNVGIVLQTILLERALVRRVPQLAARTLLPSLLKISLAAAVMGAATWLGWWWLQSLALPHRTAELLAVFALIPIAVVLYGASLLLLKMEDREELTAFAKKILGRLGLASKKNPTA